jgi:hypothetical protein
MKELSTAMRAGDVDYDLFFEIKANLTRDEIRLLVEGCITHVQPGIESLSTRVLRLMDKGVTAAQNLNSLRWFLYFGVHASWNLIYGFPGELDEDYQEQARLIPKIVFLPPPDAEGEIWLERFSPYFRDAAENRSFQNVRPLDSYQFIYPSGLDIQKAAYFFEGDLVRPVASKARDAMLASLKEWRSRWQGADAPMLVYQKMFDGVRIIDGRAPAPEHKYFFYTGWLAEVFLACVDRPVSVANIQTKLVKPDGTCLSMRWQQR